MKLVKFLQKLNREQVTIELKNGTVVQGTVVGVDATMNCHLKKAKVTVYVRYTFVLYSICGVTSIYIYIYMWVVLCCLYDVMYVDTHTHTHTHMSPNIMTYSRGKNPVSYSTLSVRGSTMRSWLLPESLNLDALLVDDTPKHAQVVKAQQQQQQPARGRGGGGRGRGRGRR
jgi:small nuclear ribonucleoprotein D1